MPDRFGLYGVIPRERETNEPMDYDEQNIGDSGETLIYETDDEREAKAIYVAGGFMKDGVWHAVTRYEDRTKAGGMGGGPVQPSVAQVIDKRDYDQT
jgi:hypothetical protein